MELHEAREEARAEGIAEGEARGKAEGEARGKAEGEARGKAEGKAEALFEVLAARGLDISEGARQRILACRDKEQLGAWLRSALTACSVEELLG
jgi:flagellar biosynthesis/type III secretory pathway protein FliH